MNFFIGSKNFSQFFVQNLKKINDFYFLTQAVRERHHTFDIFMKKKILPILSLLDPQTAGVDVVMGRLSFHDETNLIIYDPIPDNINLNT